MLVSERKHRLPPVLAIFKVNSSDRFILLLSCIFYFKVREVIHTFLFQHSQQLKE